MSLHTLANHMAAHGRGPDTTLVHMAPTELASLQDLAQRHGGSLTINPHTGLPEAGFLSSLLPMALGAAAQFLPGMQGMGAGMIGAGIGAIQGLASGSLSQGLLAGMSAYSGAGLSGGLLGSGIAVGNEGMQEQMKQLQAAQAEATNKALTEAQRAMAEQTAAKLSQQLQQMQTTELNKESRGFMDNLSTAGKGLTGGFKNFYTSMGTTPGAFGPKTTLAAGLTPLLLSGIEDSQGQVPAAKSTDSDRGAYANSGATFRPNWVGPYDNKTPGGEKTYAMPYYGADGGLTHMADGGMAEGGMPQQDAYQEYMDYLNKNLPSGGSAPVTPFKYAAPEEIVSLNTANVAALTPESIGPTGTRGGMTAEEINDPTRYVNFSDEEKASYHANNPIKSAIAGGLESLSGMRMLDRFINPEYAAKKELIRQGFSPRSGLSYITPPSYFKEGTNTPVTPSSPAVQYNIANTDFSGMDRPSRDNGGMGVNPGGYSNSLTQSNDQGDGGGANGGLSTLHGFQHMAQGGISDMYNLGSYSDGGRLLRGPGDGVSDSIPATIGQKQPARLADGEFVVPARIVSEIGNGSTEAGARKLYAMMDRVQKARGNTMGKGKVAKNSRAERYLPA